MKESDIMNEEFNPYNNTPEIPRQSENMQPQPPFNQQPPQPQMPPIQNGYPYPPQYSNAQRLSSPYRDPQKVSGAAKAFGVVSFIIGCFALIITSMIFFNFRSTISEKYGYAVMWSTVVGLPALIFGVVSLMKKTDKKLFPILGIVFAVILMLCAFITYFFMVNTAPAGSYTNIYY